MNIIFYCNEYPPFKTGGIGSVTKIVSEELVRRGNNVYVIGYYPNGQNGITCDNINGVIVYRLNLGYRLGFFRKKLFSCVYRLGYSHLYIQREVNFTEQFIQSIIDRYNVDLIEFPDFYDFTGLSKQALKFRKYSIPVILRIHGCVSFIDSLKGLQRPWAKINDQLHFNRCNSVSAVSKYSLQYVCDNYYFNDNMLKEVIYNPIEDSYLNQSANSNKKRILFIGKLTKTKGCYSLLKAFNNIALEYNDWEIFLIGNGNQKIASSYVNPIFLHRVHFLGFCDRDRIKKEIDDCSFACIPTYFENFSMVALEVMARGKALIFTERTSGNEVIFNNIDGILVDPENTTQIELAIRKLIEDVVYRNRISEKAFIKVRDNFSISSVIKDVENFYNRLLQINNNCDCYYEV